MAVAKLNQALIMAELQYLPRIAEKAPTVRQDEDGLYYLFHGQDTPEESAIIFAHRRGSGSALVRNTDGGWTLCRGWHEPDALEGKRSQFRAPDLEQMALLLSRSDEEQLMFLPKAVIERPRRMVFREHVLLLRSSSQRGEGFRLEHSVTGVISPLFKGRPWEDADAIRWCQTSLRCEEAARAPLEISPGAMGELDLGMCAIF